MTNRRQSIRSRADRLADSAMERHSVLGITRVYAMFDCFSSIRLLTVVVFSGGLALGKPALACEAEGFVLSAGNAFLAAARRGSPQAFASVASRYADLNSVALFALGPHRKSLPKSRQAEYFALTRAYMGRFMSKNASRFSGTGLKITGCSGNTVNASTAGGRKLLFRVAKGKGGYRVQDVNVSSVWLANQMRSRFVGILNRSNGSIDALFDFLRR